MDLRMQQYLDQLAQPVGGGASAKDITTENAQNDAMAQQANDAYARSATSTNSDPYGIKAIIASLMQRK